MGIRIDPIHHFLEYTFLNNNRNKHNETQLLVYYYSIARHNNKLNSCVHDIIILPVLCDELILPPHIHVVRQFMLNMVDLVCTASG